MLVILGGRIGGSVTSKTAALICDVATTSAAPSKKYKDASSRGVPVLDASTPWVQRVIDGIKANSTEK
jgi:NAD-dependent DNA ligase